MVFFRVIVATFYDRLAVFDNATLQHKFSVTCKSIQIAFRASRFRLFELQQLHFVNIVSACFPSISNCVSLTSTWLAYCDRFVRTYKYETMKFHARF